MKVLLIEDDPVLQDLYKEILTAEGFEIQATGDGTAGIALMKSFDPDIVLLDLILPGMTGFSVLDIVKKDPQINTIPIIIMTNIYADGEDLVKNHGVRGFVIKSEVTPDEIVKKIKGIMGIS